MSTIFLKNAVDYAFANALVLEHLHWRDANGYTALSMNVLYGFFRKYNGNLIKISFDYEKNGANATTPEDVVVYLTWNKQSYLLYKIAPVYEVE